MTGGIMRKNHKVRMGRRQALTIVLQMAKELYNGYGEIVPPATCPSDIKDAFRIIEALATVRKSRPSRWRDIADENVRHRWDLDCQCLGSADPGMELERTIHVGPDNFVNGGIPICEACGRDRSYVKTQILKR